MTYLGFGRKTLKTILMSVAGKENGDDCNQAEWSGFVQTIKSFIKKQNIKTSAEHRAVNQAHTSSIKALQQEVRAVRFDVNADMRTQQSQIQEIGQAVKYSMTEVKTSMGSEIQDMKSEIRSLKEDNKSILNILKDIAKR